ncbi:MAG: LysM domain-containing protein [Anaerolineaceae bacterium]
MNKKFVFIPVLLFLLALLMVVPQLTHPAQAQIYYYTPTADSAGNVIYTVKAGDTCDSIALLNGVSLQDLQTLNQLTVDDCRFLTEGKKLRLAIIPTPVITPGPSPTPTSSLPTPAPPIGFGTLCVYLFDDVNGNAMVDSGEGPIAGGKINISSSASNTSLSGTTLASADAAPVCFNDIPESNYTISMAIPDGYNATSNQNVTIKLKAGDTATVNFSAQQSGRSSASHQQGSSRSILLAVVGGIVLIAGVGIGLYARFVFGKSPRR